MVHHKDYGPSPSRTSVVKHPQLISLILIRLWGGLKTITTHLLVPCRHYITTRGKIVGCTYICVYKCWRTVHESNICILPLEENTTYERFLREVLACSVVGRPVFEAGRRGKFVGVEKINRSLSVAKLQLLQVHDPPHWYICNTYVFFFLVLLRIFLVLLTTTYC